MNDRKNDIDGPAGKPGSETPRQDDRTNYDPYEKDPGAGKRDDERVREADEREARRQEGVAMKGSQRLDDSTTAPIIDTGITGQMARGSYGFNDATGQGAYMDRTRDGSADVASDPVAQPGDGANSNDLGDPNGPEVAKQDG